MIFVTPTPPRNLQKSSKNSKIQPIVRTRGRNGQKQQLAFSTLLPPINTNQNSLDKNSIPVTLPTISNEEPITPSSFSEIFSTLAPDKNEKLSQEEDEPRKYYQENFHQQPIVIPLQNEAKVTEKPFSLKEEYISNNFKEDPRLTSYEPKTYSPTETTFVVDNLITTQPRNKIDRYETINRKPVNTDFDSRATTKLKGKLQTTESYLAPTTGFDDIINPVDVSINAPRNGNNDKTYSVEVDQNKVTNGHTGKIMIDIQVNINDNSGNQSRISTNSHGPVHPTYSSQTEDVTTTRYVKPTIQTVKTTKYVKPTEAADNFLDLISPIDEGYSAPTTEKHPPPSPPPPLPLPERDPIINPRKPARFKNLRNFGTKIKEEKPNDFVAPDYNEEFKKDDLYAPDIATEYTGTVTEDSNFYDAPEQHFDDYKSHYEDDQYYEEPYEEAYEEPYEEAYKQPYEQAYEEVYEEETEPPKHHHKTYHKNKHGKSKHKSKVYASFEKAKNAGNHYETLEKPYDDFFNGHHHEDSFYKPFDSQYDSEYTDHFLEKPYYKKEEKKSYLKGSFFEPLKKPHFDKGIHYHEDTYYDSLEKPFYKEPFYEDDHYESHGEPHFKETHYDSYEEAHYKPIEKPHYEESYHGYEEPDYEEHHEPYYKPLEKPHYEEDFYEEPYYEPLEKPHHEETYYEEPYYEPLEKPHYEDPDYYGDLYQHSTPRGYYSHADDLIPELKDIIKPLDWDVHDFSSWRRMLDTKDFGGTLRQQGHRL